MAMAKGWVVVVRCAGTDETGLDEQYLHSKSVASFASPTMIRASTTLVHLLGVEDLSHAVRVSLRQSKGSLYCFSVAFSVPTPTPSCTPILYHFARTSFNSFITTRKSSTLSTGPGLVSMSPLNNSSRVNTTATTLLPQPKGGLRCRLGKTQLKPEWDEV